GNIESQLPCTGGKERRIAQNVERRQLVTPLLPGKKQDFRTNSGGVTNCQREWRHWNFALTLLDGMISNLTCLSGGRCAPSLAIPSYSPLTPFQKTRRPFPGSGRPF